MKDENNERPRVIVRAWGDEPVARVLYRLENNGNTAFIGSEQCNRPIGIPAEQVFPYDAERFAALKAAYGEGDSAELLMIYASLEENKRLDILIPDARQSLHDQERLAHPDRAAEGDSQ